MKRVNVSSAVGEYPVLIGSGLLSRVGEIARTAWPGRRALIVTDQNVARLYLDPCRTSLVELGFEVESVIINPGEESKTLDTLYSLYNACHAAHLSRFDGVIALGGGVVGDLAGFAAATYLRGVAHLQVPTTLLAQVDAAVGGKTGIDLPFGKNMVGAFYPPKAVVAALKTLQTLEPRRFAEGMAEVIKYGCLFDEALFSALEREEVDLAELVSRSVQLKAEVVARDERDKGERNLLNFGHTIGHALEQATKFSRYTHGEAVAIGMVTALKIGERLDVTEREVRSRLVRLLEKWGLPTESEIPLEKLVPALASDKKRWGSEVQFVLLQKIGLSLLKPIAIGKLEQLLGEVWSGE